MIKSLVHILWAFESLTVESSWLEQVGVLVVELHLALLEDLGLMWNGICGLTNFLEILVFLLKLGYW